MRNRVAVEIVGDQELARSVNAAGPSKLEDADADSSEADDQERSGAKRVNMIPF